MSTIKIIKAATFEEAAQRVAEALGLEGNVRPTAKRWRWKAPAPERYIDLLKSPLGREVRVQARAGYPIDHPSRVEVARLFYGEVATWRFLIEEDDR